MIDQNTDPDMVAMASGYTTKMSPGPEESQTNSRLNLSLFLFP